jgi:hypothetical protein
MIFHNKNNKIAILFSIIAVIISFMPYYWYYLFGFRGNIFYIKEGVPLVLWCVCLIILNIFKTKKIKTFWWVWVSAPFCFWPLVTTLFVFMCWKLKGFAP